MQRGMLAAQKLESDEGDDGAADVVPPALEGAAALTADMTSDGFASPICCSAAVVSWSQDVCLVALSCAEMALTVASGTLETTALISTTAGCPGIVVSVTETWLALTLSLRATSAVTAAMICWAEACDARLAD